jgi:hypothetical protein
VTLLVPIHLSKLKRGESSSQGEDQSDESSHSNKKTKGDLSREREQRFETCCKTSNCAGLVY